jgi:hypothetical protein
VARLKVVNGNHTDLEHLSVYLVYNFVSKHTCDKSVYCWVYMQGCREETQYVLTSVRVIGVEFVVDRVLLGQVLPPPPPPPNVLSFPLAVSFH